jgi:hypothetical protein
MPGSKSGYVANHPRKKCPDCDYATKSVWITRNKKHIKIGWFCEKCGRLELDIDD